MQLFRLDIAIPYLRYVGRTDKAVPPVEQKIKNNTIYATFIFFVYLRQIVVVSVFCVRLGRYVGVAALQLFRQANWTGPPVDVDDTTSDLPPGRHGSVCGAIMYDVGVGMVACAVLSYVGVGMVACTVLSCA